MAVLPEQMNPMPDDAQRAIRIISEYIGYMRERIEFSFANTTKIVNAAGVSQVEVYVMVVALQNDLAALQSSVNGLLGRMNSAEGSISALQSSVNSLVGRMSSAEGNITNLQSTVGGHTSTLQSINSSISDLDARVRALEGNPEDLGGE